MSPDLGSRIRLSPPSLTAAMNVDPILPLPADISNNNHEEDLELRGNLSQIGLSLQSSAAAIKIDANLRLPNSNNSNNKDENDRELRGNSSQIMISAAPAKIDANLQLTNSTDHDNSNNKLGENDLESRSDSSQIRLSPPSSAANLNSTGKDRDNGGDKSKIVTNDNNNNSNNIEKDQDIRLSPPSSAANLNSNGKDHNHGGDKSKIAKNDNNNNSNNSEKHGECLTPLTAEHKIPKILCCPPAPRKPRTSTNFSCKRKLEFFEIINHEQVDQFFRSNYNDLVFKRICTRNI